MNFLKKIWENASVQSAFWGLVKTVGTAAAAILSYKVLGT